MKNQRIAIYGGSFDPPHVGHEQLARLAVKRFALDQLLVIPALLPVHRSLSGRVDGATKLAWLRAIWHDEPRIMVMDWESAAPTPTIATLRRFSEAYPQVVPLLLMGSDAAAGMGAWVDYPNHRRLCNLAVFHRAGLPTLLPDGWSLILADEWLDDANRCCGRVLSVDAALPAVSASQVRQALQKGEAVDGLLPDIIKRDVSQRYCAIK